MIPHPAPAGGRAGAGDPPATERHVSVSQAPASMLPLSSAEVAHLPAPVTAGPVEPTACALHGKVRLARFLVPYDAGLYRCREDYPCSGSHPALCNDSALSRVPTAAAAHAEGGDGATDGVAVDRTAGVAASAAPYSDDSPLPPAPATPFALDPDLCDGDASAGDGSLHLADSRDAVPSPLPSADMAISPPVMLKELSSEEGSGDDGLPLLADSSGDEPPPLPSAPTASLRPAVCTDLLCEDASDGDGPRSLVASDAATAEEAAPHTGASASMAPRATTPPSRACVTDTPPETPPQWPVSSHGVVSAVALAAASPSEQKPMLGRALFPRISLWHPRLAPKLTGMLLELDNSTLLALLASDALLQERVTDALKVLEGTV